MPADGYNGKQETDIKQFEYKVMCIPVTAQETLLNGLGKEGWELVAVFNMYLYLKREKTGN